MSSLSMTSRESIEPTSAVIHPWKPAMDRVFAAVLLVPAAPVMLVVMGLVRLTSPGPMIYRQTRLGRGGRPFTMYKIRTMIHDCERLTGARWLTPGDCRVTPIGRFLRATHLDELPQLWNILRGEMSLVGPRPERPEIVPQLERVLPAYRERLRVRPGVTGLAQVQLAPDTDLESVRRKLDMRPLLRQSGQLLAGPANHYGDCARVPRHLGENEMQAPRHPPRRSRRDRRRRPVGRDEYPTRTMRPVGRGRCFDPAIRGIRSGLLIAKRILRQVGGRSPGDDGAVRPR